LVSRLGGSLHIGHHTTAFQEAAYYGLYRDDGLGVFKGNWSYERLTNWRNNFQKSVNKLAGGSYLQFTCNIWLTPSDKLNQIDEYDNNVTIERKSTFPYLDMELKWADDNSLKFQVHLKPNQQLKYLNKGSAHTNACFRAIPAGVYNSLTKLTSMDNANADKNLEEIYPDHFKALRNANLISDRVPTLREEMSKLEEKKKISKSKANEDGNRRKR
jgi:hypothetical protein